MPISIGDFEKLSKLARLLAIPFLAVALYKQFGFWLFEFDSDWQKWLGSSNPIKSNLSKAIAFFGCVSVVALGYVFVNSILYGHKVLLYFLALSLLSFGVLGLDCGNKALSETTNLAALESYNYFWHLASFCWGIDIFNTIENCSEYEEKVKT